MYEEPHIIKRSESDEEEDKESQWHEVLPKKEEKTKAQSSYLMEI